MRKLNRLVIDCQQSAISSRQIVGCRYQLLRRRNLFFRLTVSLLWINLYFGKVEAQNWKLYLTNELQATYGYYFQNLENSNRTIPELNSRHELQARYKTNFTAFASLHSIVNQHEKDRRRLWLNEAYVAFNKGSFYGKLGKQIVKWGTLTGLSALDLANVYDYYDFIRTDREALGIWGADFKLNLKKFQFQLKVAPFDNISRLYFQQHRWIRLPNQLPRPDGTLLPVAFSGLQKTAFSGITYGASIGIENEGSDLKMGWYSGQNDIPQYHTVLGGDMTDQGIPYEIALTYHPLNIGAVSFTKLLGDFSAWTEVSFIQNQRMLEGQLMPDNYFGLTIGLDRLFLFENPEKQLKFLLQYLKNFTDAQPAYAVNDIDHVLDHALLLDLNFQFNYVWKASLRSVLNLSDTSHYFSTGIDYKMTDKFSWNVHLDLLYGNQQHFFGYYRDNTRIFLTLNYQL